MQSQPPPFRLGGFRLLTARCTTNNSFVYLAKNVETQEKIIAKIIPHQLSSEESRNSECNIQSSISHIYIMQLNDYFDDRNFRVFNYAECWIWNDVSIYSIREAIFRPLIAVLIYRLLKAVDALHRVYILHGDIKPENIVLGETDPEPFPQIIDFGHSCVLDTQPFCKCRKMTCIYSSPEVLDHKPHGFPSDIWSLGMTFYYFIEKKNLLQYNHLEIMKNRALQIHVTGDSPIWREAPSTFKTMIKRMLEPNPEKKNYSWWMFKI